MSTSVSHAAFRIRCLVVITAAASTDVAVVQVTDAIFVANAGMSGAERSEPRESLLEGLRRIVEVPTGAAFAHRPPQYEPKTTTDRK